MTLFPLPFSFTYLARSWSEREHILSDCQQNNPASAREYTVEHILAAGLTRQAYILSRGYLQRNDYKN